MKTFLLFVIMLFLIQTIYGQEKKLKIQYLDIRDSSFIKNVTSIIENEKNSTGDEHRFFKNGLGYISVTVYDYIHGDTLLKYNVLPMMSNIGRDDAALVYPFYYTYIDGRPILVYLHSINSIAKIEFDEKSKQFISKLIQPFLEKTKDVQMYDENGRKTFRDKNFRINYFKFFGEKDFYIVKKSRSYQLIKASW